MRPASLSTIAVMWCPTLAAILTQMTNAGEMMLGEFGWFAPALYVFLALIFWHYRNALPKLPAEGV